MKLTEGDIIIPDDASPLLLFEQGIPGEVTRSICQKEWKNSDESSDMITS